MDIRPGRRCVERLQRGRVQPEQVDDVRADLWSRGRCKCADRNSLQRPLEPGQFLVRGAEVMTPLADAVGFVDGDTVQLALRVDGLEVPPEGLCLAELGRHVEKTGPRVS